MNIALITTLLWLDMRVFHGLEKRAMVSDHQGHGCFPSSHFDAKG